VFADVDEPSAGLYGVFAAQPGGGSVAGIVLTREPLPAELMQAIARDFAAPTTGFIVLGPKPDGALPIQFFTPRQEIDACGYVTLAAATALRDAGHWTVPGTGTLTAAGGTYRLALSPDAVRLDIAIRGHHVVSEEMRRAIGVALDLPLADLPCEVINSGLRHLVVPIADDDALSALVPDRTTAEQLGAAHRVDTIALVTDHSAHDALRLRDLCAPIGDLEEPTSGTTAAAVTDFTHRHRGTGALVIRQGEDMGRPSVLHATMRPDRLVEVRGVAKPILTGRLH
jgi:trans-2,3-dihydro-3-hydroxyanthranilate isomerase